LAPLGSVGSSGTRWADWLDLLTPVLVLGAAGYALYVAGGQQPNLARWLVFVIGAVVYTEGHGIHLAANSINNVSSSDIAHLWDEPVGHYVWHLGVSLVVAALAWAGSGFEFPSRRSWNRRAAIIGVVAVGVTYATNGLEGGTAPLGLTVSAGLMAWGVRHKSTVAGLLIPTFGLSILIFAIYGLIHRGFPQPSEVGWSIF